jgi:hypothetical protein
MKLSDMLECKDCNFSNACNMCGITIKKRLQEKLNYLCEGDEKIIVSDLTINYLMVTYSDSKDTDTITLTSYKPNLTKNKIDDEVIELMDRFRELYKKWSEINGD